MFFKSKESVATALAAGNRRLRAIELRPVSDALNPIMIRSKQRQISNSINLPSDPSDNKPDNPSVLVKNIRLALCYLLNFLHLPESDRTVSNIQYLNFKKIVAAIPELEKYYFFSPINLNNNTAVEIKQFLVSLPEYVR